MDARVLTLDCAYQALGFISWERAMTLYFEGKVEIIHEYADKWIHSATQTFKVPSVVRFLKNVFKRIRKPRFSRENVFLRDKGKCMYCGKSQTREEFTLDHLTPRALGGTTCWENVLVCCITCNRKKADKTCAQAGMRVLVKPTKPSNLNQILSWMPYMPESWRDFLYWNGELENDNP